jgi:hypothetical protein
MNRRVFFVAVVVLFVTVAVFVYRSRFRDESLPQGLSVGTSLPSQASSRARTHRRAPGAVMPEQTPSLVAVKGRWWSKAAGAAGPASSVIVAQPSQTRKDRWRCRLLPTAVC